MLKNVFQNACNKYLRSKRFRGAKSEEQGFRRFARAKNKARAKIRRGWGKGRKETLAAKHCESQILRWPANGARDWLGWSNIIDMCQSKVLKF